MLQVHQTYSRETTKVNCEIMKHTVSYKHLSLFNNILVQHKKKKEKEKVFEVSLTACLLPYGMFSVLSSPQ